jgi:hypothetical protein
MMMNLSFHDAYSPPVEATFLIIRLRNAQADLRLCDLSIVQKFLSARTFCCSHATPHVTSPLNQVRLFVNKQ